MRFLHEFAYLWVLALAVFLVVVGFKPMALIVVSHVPAPAGLKSLLAGGS